MAVRRRSNLVSLKRRTTWIFLQPTEFTLAAATSTTLAFLANAALLAFRPFTVVRTHLEVMLRSDQAAAIETQGVGIGQAVVSEQSAAAGIASLPTPITDLGSDMFYVHRILFADESSLTDRTRPASRLTIDSKAMRKVEGGETIATVLEGAGVGAGMIVTLGGRALIKTN